MALPSDLRPHRILLVEDEPGLAESVRYALTDEGYEVLVADSGVSGLESAKAAKPDLVLLDLMLPGLDGLEVCKRLKTDGAVAGLPIVMVTARGEEADVVTGLELGAEDYVTKPFSPRVLVARVRAVLRRRREVPADDTAVIRTHGIEIHPGRHTVTVDGAAADLTATEFKILHFLAQISHRTAWLARDDRGPPAPELGAVDHVVGGEQHLVAGDAKAARS